MPSWLRYLPECGSTNTWAKEHRGELIHGDVVYTPKQTAGRGQQGRVWLAPPGVLTFSLNLDSVAPLAPGLTVVTGLALLYAVEALCPRIQDELGWKWPNDLYANGRKLAGVLTEVSTTETHPRMIIGIGLNRDLGKNQAPELTQAISLRDLSDTVPSDLELIKTIRFYLLQAYSVWQQQGLTPLLPALNQRHILQGKRVTIQQGQAQFDGIVGGITPDGGLYLHCDSGEVVVLSHGHVVKISD